MRPVNAYLNGVSLRDLDPRILVRTVNEQAPQESTEYGDRPGEDGQVLISRRRETRRVSIVFAVRELRDLTARANVVDAANRWAQDGRLCVSYRPDKQLRVAVAARACMQDPRNYNEEYRIDLDAPWPYWADISPRRATLSGATGSGSLTNLGSAPARVCVTVTPTGGALSTLTLTVGGSAFSLSGLGVAQNTALTIGYDARGILYIRAANADKLGCRSAASADDLIAAPGISSVGFTANTACNVVFEVRGCYL